MDQIYKNFYRQFYFKTGGFIPTKPLNSNLFPGDYFQIKNGEIVLLGNVYRDSIIGQKQAELSGAISLHEPSWNFCDGISKPYSGRANGQDGITGQFEFSRQVLSFADKGSFIFRSEAPKYIKISNWKDIEQQLLLKMTYSLFSFRELYIVTESATAASTTLAIAGRSGAELELTAEVESSGLVDLFGYPSAKITQSKDIDYYHRETKRKPAYFKAKKLDVREEKLASFDSRRMEEALGDEEWAANLFDSNFHSEIEYSPQILRKHAQDLFLDRLRPGELNAETAVLYFAWSDANLDDVEKLF